MENQVVCYRNNVGNLLVAPIAKNPVNGWGMVVNRVQRLDGRTEASELGRALHKASEECDYALFDPAVGHPEMVASGEKSWNSFVRKWQQVTVFFAEVVRVVPSSRDKKGRYWLLLDQQSELPTEVSPEDLGQAALAAFGLCREGERTPG